MALGNASVKDKKAKPGSTMKTIDKAVYLLGFFTLEAPEHRLSDLARAAGIDKATAMRVLASLAAGGLIEQHPETRKYRLGTAVLHLARLREASFPVLSVLQPILDELTVEVGELTHACLCSGSAMMTIAVAEPNRATRVYINPAQALPFHATASGLAYMAHVSEDVQKAIVRKINFKSHASRTISNANALAEKLLDVRRQGVAVSSRSFEDDVTGIAAPIFDWHGNVQATVSAACIASRCTVETQKIFERAVLMASLRATRAMGGTPPAQLLAAVKASA